MVDSLTLCICKQHSICSPPASSSLLTFVHYLLPQIDSLPDGLRAVTRGKLQVLRQELLRDMDNNERSDAGKSVTAATNASDTGSRKQRRRGGRSCGCCGASRKSDPAPDR
jgi:hypothetical protein